MAAEYQPNDIVKGTSDVYRVVRVLGSGGMGDVYEVEDKGLGKRFVLKIIRSKHSGRRDLIKRFEQEARALGRLNHPNIVEILRLDHVRGTTIPFYLMERLDGDSLRAVLARKGKIKPHLAIGIAVDILDALDHAHQKKIVHRDIKPENVILHRERPGFTIAKLIDFGIMKVLQAENDQQRGLTAEGTFIGTYAYAAPEQIFGSWNVSPHADLWSVGVMLFEMIAGVNPFTFGRKSEKEIVSEVRSGEPAPVLSTFESVPDDLCKIVASALSKERQGRPKDAISFATELRRIKRDHYLKEKTPEPSEAHTTTVEELSEPPARTVEKPITLGALATATALDPAPAFLAAHFAPSVADTPPSVRANGETALENFAGTAAFEGTEVAPESPVAHSPSESVVDREAATNLPNADALRAPSNVSECVIQYADDARSTIIGTPPMMTSSAGAPPVEDRSSGVPSSPGSHHGFAAGDGVSKNRFVGPIQWARGLREYAAKHRPMVLGGVGVAVVLATLIISYRLTLSATSSSASAKEQPTTSMGVTGRLESSPAVLTISHEVSPSSDAASPAPSASQREATKH